MRLVSQNGGKSNPKYKNLPHTNRDTEYWAQSRMKTKIINGKKTLVGKVRKTIYEIYDNTARNANRNQIELELNTK